MKRAFKIILRSLSGIIIFLIMLPIVVSIVLQIDFVQNFAVTKATELLSRIANTKVTVNSVALDFFTSARFGGLYIEDYRGDTLLYAKNLRVAIDNIDFLTGQIKLGNTTLEEPQLNIYTDSLGRSNINDFFEKFASEEPNPNPPNFMLNADGLRVVDGRFTMRKYGFTPTPQTINFDDLSLKSINLEVDDISVFNYNIGLELGNLSFEEKSGFKLKQLESTLCVVDSTGLYLTDVELRSTNSELKMDSLNLVTANQKWTDWQNFNDSMLFGVNLRDSRLSTSTLSYLTGAKFFKDRPINISEAKFSGKVSKISAELNDISYVGNKLWGKFNIERITDITKARLDVEISSLMTSAEAIEGIAYATSGGVLTYGDSSLIANLKDIELKLDFSGGISQFNSKLNIKSSSSGVILSEFKMIRGDSQGVVLAGNLSTNEFLIGQALGIKELGHTSLSGDFSLSASRGEPIVFDADFNLSELLFNDYKYQDIVVDGAISSRKFVGEILSNDSNLNLDVNGLFDYSDDLPKYNIEVDLKEANLFALGFNRRDSVSILSAKFLAEGSGTSIDDFNGWGKIDSIYYLNGVDTVTTSAINIDAVALEQYREIKLSSHFADISLRGRHSFLEVPQYLSSSLERFIPSYEYISEEFMEGESKLLTHETKFPFSDGYYQFLVQVKEANNVASIIVPSLEIASGTSINFYFNPYLDQLRLKANSDYITSKNFLIEKLDIDSRNIEDSLSLFATSDMIALGDTYLPNFTVLGSIKQNIIELGAKFKDERDAAHLSTTTRFARLDSGLAQLQVELHPTAIMLDSMEWMISPSKILLDTTKVSIDNFSIYSKTESLSINGFAGKTTQDTVKIELKNANLAPLSYFTKDLGYDIKCYADGSVNLVSLLNTPIMFAQVDFRDIDISGHKIASAKLLSLKSDSNNSIDFEIQDSEGHSPIYGAYDIPAEELALNINLPKLPLSLLDPMLSGIITNSQGDAATDLTLTIGSGDVSLDGSIEFEKFATTIDFTKARYTIQDAKIEVRNSSFFLPETKITDGLGAEGTIKAKFTTLNFGDMAYDVNLKFENLLALNTTVEDNSSFFGKAYGTGKVDIFGNDKKVAINIVAQTAKNSQITMPLSGASNIEEANFIRFIQPRSDSTKKRNIQRLYRRKIRVANNKSSTEIDVNLNLDVLPNTLAQIELDAKVGDIIKARGQGRILMNINPTLDIFTMSGPVTVTEGNYLFTLQTIINKRFVLQPGGTIQWTGDPTNPDIDLTALYKLKTSISPLTSDVNDTGKANIDCGIILTGKLLTPDIEFSIEAPSADAETQNALRNSLNTEEALSMQFLSLMLANSFMPDMGTASIGTMGSSVAGVTGAEFLSNQLSNLISNEKFDLRLGYTPRSETTSDEFSVGAGTEIIDDVLSIEVDGNYNTQNNGASYAQNPFSVDAYITWNINRKGSLKLKGFTRTIDRFDENQGMQESGVGVYFTQEFNNFKDLVDRLRKTFKGDSIINAKERELRRSERDEKLKAKAEQLLAKKMAKSTAINSKNEEEESDNQ